MNIGYTSVTFRKKSLEEIFIMAKKANLKSIELGTDVHLNSQEKINEAKSFIVKYDIKVSTIGSYYYVYKNNVDKFESFCKTAKNLNASLIRVWLGKKSSDETSNEERMALQEEVRVLAKIASIYGITIGFEFHKNTYNDNANKILKFLQELNLENVKTLWQPFGKSKEDIENLEIIYDFLAETHIFEWNKHGKRYALKRGKRFWKKVVSYLISKKFKGNLVLEFVKNDSELQFYRDLEFLNSLVNKEMAKLC